MFFPVQSIGALLAGLGVIAMLLHRQKETRAAAAAPVAFSGTFIFVGMLMAGFGCMDFGLIPLAKKLKRPAAIVLLVASFLLLGAMGYLSSKDFGNAAMNWIAQGVNVCAQGTFLAAVLIMHKAGPRELTLGEEP